MPARREHSFVPLLVVAWSIHVLGVVALLLLEHSGLNIFTWSLRPAEIAVKEDDWSANPTREVGLAASGIDLPDVQTGPMTAPREQAFTRREAGDPDASDDPTQRWSTQPMADPVNAARPEVPLVALGTILAPPAPQLTDRSAQTGAVPVAQGDPAPLAPSDSDPFSEIDSALFTEGGVQTQSARPMRLRRPRIDLAFAADATRIGRDFHVILFIQTDHTGQPRDVRVLESSGSALIDDAFRLAAFDSHFGGTMPDAFAFRVGMIIR